MPFAHAADDGLVRFRVVVHVERRIFVVQPLSPILQLFFLAPRGGPDGELHQGLRKSD